jgi:hypothetical protein
MTICTLTSLIQQSIDWQSDAIRLLLVFSGHSYLKSISKNWLDCHFVQDLLQDFLLASDWTGMLVEVRYGELGVQAGVFEQLTLNKN